MRMQRKQRGSALAEFGPALGIFLFGFFFPIIDLCGMFSSYACCMVLNTIQCREASLLSRKEALNPEGLIRHQIPRHWMANGIGRFAAIKTMPKTTVTYSGPDTMSLVTVRTECTVMPWLHMPLPLQVGGMNAPVTFSIQGCSPAESATDKG